MVIGLRERDGDFMNSSNVMFSEFFGTPGVVAYVKCLGTMDRARLRLDLMDERLTFYAPTHLSVAD